MTLQITLTVSDQVYQQAGRIAQRTRRPVEKVLSEWLDHAAVDLPVEALGDEEVLALCDLQLAQADQAELSSLLARNREEVLPAASRARLDSLMQTYDTLLLRKAQALREAVARGLRAPLSE
jgi:hypothetical protein